MKPEHDSGTAERQNKINGIIKINFGAPMSNNTKIQHEIKKYTMKSGS
jgi:hypothetical protein